jgi:hypothetical protein
MSASPQEKEELRKECEYDDPGGETSCFVPHTLVGKGGNLQNEGEEESVSYDNSRQGDHKSQNGV